MVVLWTSDYRTHLIWIEVLFELSVFVFANSTSGGEM